jgi:hypothetical protein
MNSPAVRQNWCTFNAANDVVLADCDMVDGVITLTKGRGTKLGYSRGFRFTETTIAADGTQTTCQLSYYNNEWIYSKVSYSGVISFRWGYYPNGTVQFAYDNTCGQSNMDYNVNNWEISSTGSIEVVNYYSYSKFTLTGGVGYAYQMYGVDSTFVIPHTVLFDKPVVPIIYNHKWAHHGSNTFSNAHLGYTSRGLPSSVCNAKGVPYKWLISQANDKVTTVYFGPNNTSQQQWGRCLYDLNGRLVATQDKVAMNATAATVLKAMSISAAIKLVSEHWPATPYVADQPSTWATQSMPDYFAIARQRYGDSNMASLLAAHNHSQPGEDTTNTSVRMMQLQDRMNRNWEGQYHNPAQMVSKVEGTFYPSAAIPKRHHHGSFWEDIVDVVVSVVVAYFAPELFSIAPESFIGIMIGSVVSDVASQGLRMAEGLQHGFNWEELGESFVKAFAQGFANWAVGLTGLTKGLDVASMTKKAAKAFEGVNLIEKQAEALAIQTVVETAINRRFSWRQVVNDAAQTVINDVAGHAIPDDNGKDIAAAMLQRAIAGATTTVEQDLVDDGSVDWQNVAANGIGDGLAEGVIASYQQAKRDKKTNAGETRHQRQQRKNKYAQLDASRRAMLATLEEEERFEYDEAVLDGDANGESFDEFEKLFQPWTTFESASAKTQTVNGDSPKESYTSSPHAAPATTSHAQQARNRTLSSVQIGERLKAEAKEAAAGGNAQRASQASGFSVGKTMGALNFMMAHPNLFMHLLGESHTMMAYVLSAAASERQGVVEDYDNFKRARTPMQYYMAVGDTAKNLAKPMLVMAATDMTGGALEAAAPLVGKVIDGVAPEIKGLVKGVVSFFRRDDVVTSASHISTGGRQIESVADWSKTEKLASEYYEMIRSMKSDDDVISISKNTGIPEYRIQRIKKHVFFNEHVLADGIKKRFDPDIEIVDAWNRLRQGTFVKQDLDLLEHEYFESKFEGIFKTDYAVAHNAAEDSFRVWNPFEFKSTQSMMWRP